MKRILLMFFISACIFTKAIPQSSGELRTNFYWAETYVLYEEYKEALPLYQTLIKVQPDNSNIKYRIGQCLLNIPGRKEEAISFLEAAVKDINPEYKAGKIKETKAPYDAYYYLANAYRINNQLEKAISTYEIFMKHLDPAVYDTSVVDLQIESCRNAMELMKRPLYIKKENLGSGINSQYAEINPVVSGDENIMVYNKSEPFQEALYFTRKVNGKWIKPVNIIPYLGLGFEDKNYATSLSQDGRELYIYRAGDNFDGNIFMTRRLDNDTWTNLIKLNDNINTKYWESHATISHDGKKLYFTSNRKGTYGGLDIYVSEKDSTGDWGPAKNLGPVINTKYNEESPFLSKDDKTLFFSSRGHFNMGGYDIFYSTLLDNGQWSVPLNMGYPLNTTDDDVFFDPIRDGYHAYYALIDSTGYGLTDIYLIELFSKDHPRKFFVRGIVTVKDLMNIFKDSVKISALNLEDPNAKVVVYSNPLTGEYKFELPQGKYSLIYEADHAQKAIASLELALNNPSDTFVLPGTTLAKTDFTADLFVESNRTISVSKGDTISIPLKVEVNSILSVEHWLGDSLVSTEKFIMKDTTFIYKTVPLIGDNKLIFKLTDKYSNITTSEVFISRQKVATEQPIARPEYNRVIAQKQIAAFVDLLINRADDNLKRIIKNSEIVKQKFGKVDEIISYVKKEAAKSSIGPDAVDKLALKVAVMDNILTQASVDLIASRTEGELKDILSHLNIYDAGLKTWTDLQKYVSEKSNGRILPEDLNKIAADILADIDPLISKIRDKVLLYSGIYEKGSIIKQAVSITDKNNINKSGIWLKSLYDESLKLKLTDNEMAKMFSILSATPGTETGQYLNELSGFSEEPFSGWLKNLDLKKISVKNCSELLVYLLRNKDKGAYPEIALFNTLARAIASKDIPADSITSQLKAVEKPKMFILWIILGAGLIFFIIFFLRKRKKDDKNKELQ
jgi:tetratricopeptide (TPR) repeat protein